VPAAALPAGVEDAADRGFEAFMGVGDNQLDAAQSASVQAAQELTPERLRFRRSDMQADNFAFAIGVCGHSDYCGDTDNTAALPLLEVRGIEP
jgi:hypothetical protein